MFIVSFQLILNSLRSKMSVKQEWPDMTNIYANSKIAEKAVKDCTPASSHEYVTVSPSDSITYEEISLPHSSYNTYSYMECSTTSAASVMDDTELEDDVDDDEILSWVASGMLPVNTSTTLALNQAYQEIIEQFMSRAEGVLAQIRERMKVIQQHVSSVTGENAKIRSAVKVRRTAYVYPYFRDSFGLCPGLNEEATSMRECGEYFDMLAEPKSRWSKCEQNMLFKGIAAAMQQAHITPLSYKRESLKARCDMEDVKVSDAKRHSASIIDIDKQIAKLNHTAEKDLLKLASSVDIDWNQISAETMNTSRTAVECRLAWFNHFLSEVNYPAKIKWSKDELTKLKRLGSAKGYIDWEVVARKIGNGRTAYEVFEKYQGEINESLIKSGWDRDDEEKLRTAVEQVRMGNYIPWEQVPFFVEGRTREQCHRHYMASLNPKIRRGRWQEDEDMLLIKGVEIYGERDWMKISEYVQTRTAVQCRERWCLTLNSNYALCNWSRQEDATLLLGAATMGVGSWSKIAPLLPGRSSAQCKQRYKALRRTNSRPGAPSTAITINLMDDSQSGPEPRRQMKRLQVLHSRKERVKRWYKQEFGRVPLNSKPIETDSILQDMPDSVRRIIREKLLMIRGVYGKIGGGHQNASVSKA